MSVKDLIWCSNTTHGNCTSATVGRMCTRRTSAVASIRSPRPGPSCASKKASDGVDDAFTARHQRARICLVVKRSKVRPVKPPLSWGELMGLEPVTPTLPGAGASRDQAR